jgi:hypothetical protein
MNKSKKLSMLLFFILIIRINIHYFTFIINIKFTHTINFLILLYLFILNLLNFFILNFFLFIYLVWIIKLIMYG